MYIAPILENLRCIERSDGRFEERRSERSVIVIRESIEKHREGIINEELPTFVGSFYFVFNTS